MKSPTLRKLRNRGLVAIRYQSEEGFRHGWILERRPRGGLKVHLVGDERPRNLSADEARFVKELS